MKTLSISGIYIIRNIKNNKAYIGSTVNIRKRFGHHKWALKYNKHSNLHLQRSWNLYGENNFEFSILEECKSDMLLVREDYFMECYKSRNTEFGFNLKTAERHLHSLETKKKIGLASLGNKYCLGKKLSAEHKRKIGLGGQGRVFSEDHKRKIRESNMGQKRSEEAKANNSRAQMGKRLSEEHKIKISKGNIGKRHSEAAKQKISMALNGRVFSDEWRKKLSEARNRYVQNVAKGIG